MRLSLENLPVSNQPDALSNYNTYLTHKALREAIKREAPEQEDSPLIELGSITGSSEMQSWVKQAHANPPALNQYDVRGNRVDQINFHPAWHKLMTVGFNSQVHSLGWNDKSPGSSVLRAGLWYLINEVDQSILCPIGMTHDSFPVMQVDDSIAAEWLPLVTSNVYDPRDLPVSEKKGAVIGMGLTEQNAGTDLRNIETVASKTDAAGEYLLNGLKWFFSAPQADAFIVLAKAREGITCFLMPRYRPDGTRNNILVRRLKTKVGDKANASSEVFLDNAWARIIGNEGGGFDVIFRMIKHSRSDAGISSGAMMHHAMCQAMHYARQRCVFGQSLVSMPLMENVLADLAIEAEAATVLSMRLARDMDEEKRGVGSGDLTRIGVALNKYWSTKRAPQAIVEAMEVWGGNGYVDELPMARLYTQAPLNSIWEGSGNVVCLDVLRAMQNEPGSYRAVLNEIELEKGHTRALDEVLNELRASEKRVPVASAARFFVQKLTLALQASLLIRYSPNYVSDAFCQSRLAGAYTGAFGSLPVETQFTDLIDRAMPQE